MAITKRGLQRWIRNFEAVATLRATEQPTLSNDDAIELALSMIRAGQTSGAGPDDIRLKQDEATRATWALLRSRWA